MSDADDAAARLQATISTDLDGSTVTIDGVEQQLAQKFKDVINDYVGKGAAAILAAGEDIEAFGEKLVAVAEDEGTGAAVGASIGTVFPVIGNIAGGAIGAFIGGVYGVMDKFGGDIKNFLNPNVFNDSDYDRMRKAGILSGGIPNPGFAPDNEKGTIYPDGKTSGGDYPRHPGPGVQSVRGDTPYPAPIPKGMIPGPDGYPIAAWSMKGDPVVVGSVDLVRQAALGGLASYMEGLKTIDALIATAKVQLKKKGTTTATRNGYLDKITKAWATLSAATRTDGQTPDAKGFRSDLDKMLPQPPPFTTADLIASLKGVKLKTMISTPALNLATIKHFTTPMAVQTVHANASDAAHALVTAANAGDPQAAQAIQGVVTSAANGDATAQHVLSVISLADAQQTINRLIARYVFGVGA